MDKKMAYVHGERLLRTDEYVLSHAKFDDGRVRFSLEPLFETEEVFGAEIKKDDCVQILASFNLLSERVADTLLLRCFADSKNRIRKYEYLLSSEEKSQLLGKMKQACNKVDPRQLEFWEERILKAKGPVEEIADELAFESVLKFAEGKIVDEDLYADQLRSLWTAYCIHARLDTDSKDYESALIQVWRKVSGNKDSIYERACYGWNDCDSFVEFMSDNLREAKPWHERQRKKDRQLAFEDVLEFARKTSFVSETECDYLLVMWMAYCIRYDLVPFSREYYQDGEELWKAVSEAEGYSTFWKNANSLIRFLGQAWMPIYKAQVQEEKNKESEFSYLVQFSQGACFDSEIECDHLRALWVAYCLHYYLVPSADAYKEDIEILWKTISKTEGDNAFWGDFESFEAFLSKDLS